MADRILIFHMPERKGQHGDWNRIGPTYYMDGDYMPVALRVHAEGAPSDRTLEIDILDDGVSIFTNRASIQNNAITSAVERQTTQTTGSLPKGENTEDNADVFKSGKIAEGSWVHCEMPYDGNARNVTIQLELEKSV